MLNEQIKLDIKKHAHAQHPKECCGLIVRSNGKIVIFPSRNDALNTKNNFSINPFDYLRAAEFGEVFGCYHSHCGNIEVFSETDKLNSENHKITFVLYNVKSDNFLVYEPSGSYNRYVGREFKIGENDCFSLIRDYFKTEFKINIKDYHRAERWFDVSSHYFDTHYAEEGFVKVSEGYSEDIKKNDICLIKHFEGIKHASHAMIYLGNDFVLHHRRGSVSTIEKYIDAYKRRTMLIVRHELLNK